MPDIFDSTILCKKCDKKMEKTEFSKNRFILRAMVCPKCNDRIIHPLDEAEYSRFINLRNKEFKVKMRLVGNSYAVSIPMEIVNFMNQQQKMMDEMVKLCFEDMGRLSLNFNKPELDEDSNTRVIKTREIKIIKNNKPVLHTRQFLDSAHPYSNNLAPKGSPTEKVTRGHEEKNKTIIKKEKIEDDR